MKTNTLLVSGPVLAEAIGVSLRHLSNLEREGVVKKEGIGKYHFTMSVRAYCEKLRQRNEQPDNVDAVNKSRKIAADADMAEIAVEREKGRLLDANRTRKAWEAAVMHARSKLLAMPERLGQQLATAPDVVSAKKILTREINETLEALSECKAEAEIEEIPVPPDEEAEEEEKLDEENED